MPRLHKLRRRQKFQYNVSRKRLNKKREKLPTIKCDAIRNAWDDRKSLNENLTSMGLVADTNAHPSFKISSGMDQLRPCKEPSESTSSEVIILSENVVGKLEDESKAKYQKKKAVAHPLPKELVKRLTGFIDKYGEDYEVRQYIGLTAMSRDYGNYNQETPAQLRSQVNRLKQVPQQWVPYLKRRGLILPSTIDPTGTELVKVMPC